MGLRLLADRIAVRPDEENKVSKGGIELITADKVNTGTVTHVGPGSYDKKGKLTPVSIEVGSRVQYLTANEQEIEVDGEKLLVMTEDSILAVIEQ